MVTFPRNPTATKKRKQSSSNFHPKQHQEHQLQYYKIYQIQNKVESVRIKDFRNHRGGNLKKHYLVQWKNITSDKFIFDII